MIVDCSCKGANPNCLLCDGKGYYKKINEKPKPKKKKKTILEPHELFYRSVGKKNSRKRKKPK